LFGGDDCHHRLDGSFKDDEARWPIFAETVGVAVFEVGDEKLSRFRILSRLINKPLPSPPR